MVHRRTAHIYSTLFFILISFMFASPAWAQLTDVISRQTLPPIAIAFPITYGLLSLFFENWTLAIKRLLIGLICVFPIGIYLYVDSLGYPPWHKTRFELVAPLFLYGICLVIPILSCILLERLSLSKTLFRLLLAPISSVMGLILIVILGDVVIPYSVKSFMPEKISEFLLGIALGILPGIVFWLIRNRNIGSWTRGVK